MTKLKNMFKDIAQNSDTGLPEVAAFFAQKYSTIRLQESGEADAVMNALDALDPVRQSAVLSMPQAVEALAANGKVVDVVDIIFTKLDRAQQTAVLSAPDVVWNLVSHNMDEAVLSIIARLDGNQRAEVLSAPHATWALMKNGPLVGQESIDRFNTVWNLFAGLDPAQQARVLAAEGAAQVLANNGKADEVRRLQAATAGGRPSTPQTFRPGG